MSGTVPDEANMHDKIVHYNHQVIELRLLPMQLVDTTKEGDGERSIRNWKILTLYVPLVTQSRPWREFTLSLKPMVRKAHNMKSYGPNSAVHKEVLAV
jgi:hypothetical protein